MPTFKMPTTRIPSPSPSISTMRCSGIWRRTTRGGGAGCGEFAGIGAGERQPDGEGAGGARAEGAGRRGLRRCGGSRARGVTGGGGGGAALAAATRRPGSSDDTRPQPGTDRARTLSKQCSEAPGGAAGGSATDGEAGRARPRGEPATLSPDSASFCLANVAAKGSFGAAPRLPRRRPAVGVAWGDRRPLGEGGGSGPRAPGSVPEGEAPSLEDLGA